MCHFVLKYVNIGTFQTYVPSNIIDYKKYHVKKMNNKPQVIFNVELLLVDLSIDFKIF